MVAAESRPLLFTHSYEGPRGRESVPVALLPIWFPVVPPPVETLTLAQVLYRSLASVREPFRRTRLILADPERVRSLYSELLDQAVGWAESNVGASLVPIALSLSRLARNGQALGDLARRLTDERSAPVAGSGCREVLELGLPVPAADVQALAAAVETGNAWVLLEDDCAGGEELKPVKKAFHAVFGESGLAHVPIVLLTARKDCSVLSDVQTFAEKGPGPAAEAPARVSGLAAMLCRVLARLGSPPMKPFLVAVALLGLGLLAFVLLHFEELARLSTAAAGGASGRAPAVASVPFLLLILTPILAMTAGYRWGLSFGSEEIRMAAVGEVILSILAVGAAFLIPLPRSMDPGLLKTACIVLASLPAAALVSFSVLGAVALVSDIVWLILSVRISRRLGATGLAAAAERYRVVLHVAQAGAELPLPCGRGARAGLPLLLSIRNAGVLSGLLAFHPQIAPQLRSMIFTGIRKDPSPYSKSIASLALDGVARGEAGATRACLESLGRECLSSWRNREDFETGMGMNGLEYLARRLCYLTNLEELIVVR
jgi:hypothetical protein